MKLIIGGTSQGKKNFALNILNVNENDIINNLHIFIRNKMIDNINPYDEILKIIEKNPNTVFIGDEVGSGIVPLDAFEREYRDMVGEIYCNIARNSTHVYRVICGIGTMIKGD